MTKPLIILDSGHAKNTAGKVAPDKSMYEWEFNNAMQYKIKARLEQLGFQVYLTNPNPGTVRDISLTKRATLANNKWTSLGKPNAVFVSLHANAYGTWTTANGVEVFHAKNASTKSKNYAKIVCKHIHNTLKSLRSDSVNRGVKSENFTVIYKATMPSILIEYAFYTNKKDLEILKNKRDDLCEATVKALCECFGITYKAPTPTPAPSTPTNYIVKIIYTGKEGLNIRQEPNASSKIMGQVYEGQAFTIVEEKNGWGKLKSGLGWISLNSKYVKRI
jgi:N-acetylmuramoyl-L-alanine amidase